MYLGPDDPRIVKDQKTALRQAEHFEATYRGKIGSPPWPSPELLLAALRDLECLSEQMDRPLVYASLLHSAKTDDAPAGALLARAQEERTAANKHLIFFDLEWVSVPDEKAASLLSASILARYRHYLEHKRAWRPHYLSEPEEKILDEKSVTGRAAFVRLFDESVSAIEFPYSFGGTTETLSLQQILAKLYDPRPAGAGSGLGGGYQRTAGKRSIAHLHLQQPRPGSSFRLQAAPLSRSDGAPAFGQRNYAPQ